MRRTILILSSLALTGGVAAADRHGGGGHFSGGSHVAAAPHYSHSAPAYHSAPVHSAPVYNHSAPVYNHSAPVYNHSAPVYNHSAPRYVDRDHRVNDYNTTRIYNNNRVYNNTHYINTGRYYNTPRYVDRSWRVYNGGYWNRGYYRNCYFYNGYYVPYVGIHYYDYYRRPALIVENWVPIPNYYWVPGAWEWDGSEWIWFPGHYAEYVY